MRGPGTKDIDRINGILELISKIWHKNPDLRLCQLIGNCFPDHIDDYGMKDLDIYYVEDDELQDRIIDTYI